jgi:aldose 1-epimerase
VRIIELACSDAAVRIAPALGSAITAFTWRNRPVMRPTPEPAIDASDVRQAACYPLIPYSNRIRDARLRFAGRVHRLTRNFGEHPHAIHGVGWQQPWSVLDADSQHAALALVHDAAGDRASAWPWPFRATQAFDLAPHAAGPSTGASLTVTLTIENTGAQPFPFGLGWHPFFPKHATTTLAFAARSVWQTDATQLPTQRVGVPARWRFDDGRLLGDTVLDNVFAGWDGAALIADPDSRIRVAVTADTACRCLVVYAPPGRDYVAVEPVTHETDAFNRAAQGDGDTGCRTLPPGAAFSCTMRVAASSPD